MVPTDSAPCHPALLQCSDYVFIQMMNIPGSCKAGRLAHQLCVLLPAGALCLFAYLYMRPFVRRGLGSAGRCATQGLTVWMTCTKAGRQDSCACSACAATGCWGTAVADCEQQQPRKLLIHPGRHEGGIQDWVQGSGCRFRVEVNCTCSLLTVVPCLRTTSRSRVCSTLWLNLQGQQPALLAAPSLKQQCVASRRTS